MKFPDITDICQLCARRHLLGEMSRPAGAVSCAVGHKAAWAGAQRSWARLPFSLAHQAFMRTWLKKLRDCKGILSTLNILA